MQMKRQWESNISVWFPFIYFQKWNCYFENKIIMFSFPVPPLIYLSERFIYFQDQSANSAAGKYVDRSWEFINRSQTHECGNWDWGRANLRKEIHKWDFRCSVIGNWAPKCQLHSKAHTAVTAPFVLYRIRIGKCLLKKFGINCQLRNKLFFITIHRSLLINATMNALRLCKLCNGVYKTPQFCNCPIAKGGTKTIAHLSIGCLIGN